MNNHWISFFVYHQDRGEVFLKKALHPLINTLEENEILVKYFFIRYWEKGFHYRIRLHIKHRDLVVTTKAFIEDIIGEYLKQNPSQRPITKNSESLIANDSYFYKEYESEHQQYGGLDYHEIVEQHFFCSSKLILELITTDENWSHGKSFWHAIQMHIIFIHSVGISKSEAQLFFQYSFEDFFLQLLKGRPYEFNEAQLQKETERMIPHFEQLWNNLENDNSLKNAWKNTWKKECSAFWEATTKLYCQNKISRNTQPILSKEPKHNKYIWFLLSKLIHMSNNRLGIPNKKELHLIKLLSNMFSIS